MRDVGLAHGLVDNKVCAVDDTWSGLRFVYRLTDRPAVTAGRGAKLRADEALRSARARERRDCGVRPVGEPDARVRRQPVQQPDRGAVVGQHRGDEPLEAVVERGRPRAGGRGAVPMPRCCQASSTVTAISASVLPGAPVVAGDGDDLVPVERDERFPAVVVDVGEPHEHPRGTVAWIGEKNRR